MNNLLKFYPFRKASCKIICIEYRILKKKSSENNGNIQHIEQVIILFHSLQEVIKFSSITETFKK